MLTPAGTVIDTVSSAPPGSGRHSFDWRRRHRTDDSGLHLPRHRHAAAPSGRRHRADARPRRRGQHHRWAHGCSPRTGQNSAACPTAASRRHQLSTQHSTKEYTMSFQQGLSGLNATSKNLEVIGNNIANASTFGAKAARAEFGDMYATALSGAGTNSIGIGVNLLPWRSSSRRATSPPPRTRWIWRSTARASSRSPTGSEPRRSTRRNGQFKVDREGYVVNNDRRQADGLPGRRVGRRDPARHPPERRHCSCPPPASTRTDQRRSRSRSTSTRALKTTVPTPAPPAIVLTSPSTYNNATSLTVYDDKGQADRADLLLPESRPPMPGTSTPPPTAGRLWTAPAPSPATRRRGRR
jgi:hypothetical protein